MPGDTHSGDRVVSAKALRRGPTGVRSKHSSVPGAE